MKCVYQRCAGSSPTMVPSPCVSTSFESGSLNRFDSVRRRQMVRLRKRSDWFLSPTFGDGAAASLIVDSQYRSLGDYKTHPVEVQSMSLMTDSRANPPSYSASDVPHVCVNESDMLDSQTVSTQQQHIDEGYSSRLAIGENSIVSLLPSSVENSLSSPATSVALNSRPNLSSENSLVSQKHLLQSETHYFLVDRFYGSSEKSENGDAC